MKTISTSTKTKSTNEKDWTEPRFLSKKDHEDLKAVKQLYEKGKFKEAMKFASDLDTAVRDEIPLAIWKEMGGELTSSGEAELKIQRMGGSQTTDYSDEFSTLKELHEDNIGKKFTDEEFNEIFSVAETMEKNVAKHADRFQSDMMGLLMLFDDATRKWEEEKLVDDVKGNPKEEIQEMIERMKKVVDYYFNDKNSNWGTVGTLANIHEQLGLRLYDTYDKHLGYSKSVREGLQRHAEASMNLLSDAEERIKAYDVKRNLPDLMYWKKFFEELLSGFKGVLHKIESNEKLSPEIKRKLEEIYSVSQSHAVSAWASELIDGRREITEDDLKKLEERYPVVERLKHEMKFEEEEAVTIPEKTKAKKYVVVSVDSLQEVSVLTSPIDYNKANKIQKDFQKKSEFDQEKKFYYILDTEVFKALPLEKREEKNPTSKIENKSEKKLSLREEAIELALKLGDKELAKYLEKAPMKSIQRRIKALREDAKKPHKKSPKKSKPQLKTKGKK